MQAHGAAEHGALEVASLADHIFNGVAVRNASDFLFDDRAFIEIHGDVVTRGSDQLHSAKEGLMVGLGTDESRKKRMMDIDNSIGILSDEVFAQDLHVARQHDKFNAA